MLHGKTLSAMPFRCELSLAWNRRRVGVSDGGDYHTNYRVRKTVRVKFAAMNHESHHLLLPTPTHFPAFPYDPPYSIQTDLMKHVYSSIEQRQVTIVESPTGTVRTG